MRLNKLSITTVWHQPEERMVMLLGCLSSTTAAGRARIMNGFVVGEICRALLLVVSQKRGLYCGWMSARRVSIRIVAEDIVDYCC